MIFNKNDFFILKKILKNIKFGLQIYFNTENTFNVRISVLNSEMRYDIKYKNILYFATNRSITLYI
jgi:hypothetical protein